MTTRKKNMSLLMILKSEKFKFLQLISRKLRTYIFHLKKIWHKFALSCLLTEHFISFRWIVTEELRAFKQRLERVANPEMIKGIFYMLFHKLLKILKHNFQGLLFFQHVFLHVLMLHRWFKIVYKNICHWNFF